jgi:hypothetical protein
MIEFGNISTGKDATPTRTVVKLPVLFRRINLEVARHGKRPGRGSHGKQRIALDSGSKDCVSWRLLRLNLCWHVIRPGKPVRFLRKRSDNLSREVGQS